MGTPSAVVEARCQCHPTRGIATERRGSDPEDMRGIVRGMNAAAEAHKDVFMAVPRMSSGSEPRRCAAGEAR